ncbi:hypothetical protein CSHISOI_08850, partial [Colletotrichum shisoi]
MAPKSNSIGIDGSESAPCKASSDDKPSGSPDTTQVSQAVQSQLRSSSRGSGEIGRSAHFSRLRRRQRSRPAPLNISQPTNEAAPLTAVENSPPPPPPTPLLAGCPGREISGATCNGREWACDFDKPPVLMHPHDLSKTAFHEHPLAQHIMLEKGWEMEQLALFGLILPEKVDNRSPTYTWDSDSEEKEDSNKSSMFDKEAKTPLKLPAAPERSRTPSNILHKVKSFANFIANSDLQKDVPELPELLDQFGLPPGAPIEPTSRTFIRPARSSSSIRPKASIRTAPSATILREKRSAGIDKSQISHPVAPEEKRRAGSDFSRAFARRKGTAESERSSCLAEPLRSPSNLVSPSLSTKLPLYLLQPHHPTVYFGKNEAPPKFRLAPPRLSPMEYARQYLLAKTKADKEGAECNISKPILIWVWTEDYREFLLLPHIPKGIQRNFLPSNDKDWKKSDFMRPCSDLYAKGMEGCLLTPLPLDLAPSSPLLPACFFDSLHPPSSSTHKRSMSIGAFTIDQPVPTESQKSPLQSTKSLLSDPAIEHLPYIPVSQIYPEPLRIKAMKSPNPASAMSPGDGAASDSSIGTATRSASSLIMNVNAEVDREMEQVLSPRTTALVAASESAKEEEEFNTPTRRAPHKPRSFPKPVPWSPPIHPPPNKPLPPIPRKKNTPSEPPPCTFVDVDCGSGSTVSRALTLSHAAAVSRAKAASLAPVITQAPGPARPTPPIATPTSEFYDPYPPPRVIWTNGDVTVSDFSIPKRIVRPAASMTAIAPRPPSLMDQRQRQIRPKESAVNVSKSASAAVPAVTTSPAPSRSRLLGKIASMTDMKTRKETAFGCSSRSGSGSGSDDAVGMRTFLGEDLTSAPALAEEKTQRSEKSAEGRKKKFFGSLFRRNKKTGE